MDGTPQPKRWPGRVLRLEQPLVSGGWTSRPRTPGPPIRLPTPPISRVRSTTWPSTGPPASACTRRRLNGTPSPARRRALRQPRTGSPGPPAQSRHPRCAAPRSPAVPSNSSNIPPASSTGTLPASWSTPIRISSQSRPDLLGDLEVLSSPDDDYRNAVGPRAYLNVPGRCPVPVLVELHAEEPQAGRSQPP